MEINTIILKQNIKITELKFVLFAKNTVNFGKDLMTILMAKDALNAVILQKSKNNYLLEKNLLNEPLLYTEIITTILKLNILMIVQKFV